MANMIEYKGYLGRFEFDDEADLFHGQIANIVDVVTFQGRSIDELREALKDSVEDYLEFCADLGKVPEKPFSGKFVVRMDPVLHRRAAIYAKKAGESLNAWVIKVIERAIHHSEAASINQPTVIHHQVHVDVTPILRKSIGVVDNEAQILNLLPDWSSQNFFHRLPALESNFTSVSNTFDVELEADQED